MSGFQNYKKHIKSKALWFVISIVVANMVGFVLPNFWFLQIPLGFTMLALFPAMLASVYSPKFASRFVLLHRWRHKNNVYSYSEINVKIPPMWKFALKTTAYSFAIIYNILVWTGLIDIVLSNPNKLPAIIGIFLLSLFAASVINMAIYLLTKSGLMFEDREDGSRINLGREMATKLDWTISPTLIISFAFAIATKLSTLPYVLMTMLVLLLFCLYAAFISFYFLRKRNMDKMIVDLKRRLNKIIPLI